MKTFQPNNKTVSRKWHIVDAKDQVLGRLASNLARTLQGTGKTYYAPHVDCGDYVVVLNADKVVLKGNDKPTQKIDFRHSGYPGGHTMTPYSDFLKKNPERAVYLAVTGMVPKNRLRSRQMARLRIFKGDQHPHAAQFAVPKKKEEASAEKIENGKEA